MPIARLCLPTTICRFDFFQGLSLVEHCINNPSFRFWRKNREPYPKSRASLWCPFNSTPDMLPKPCTPNTNVCLKRAMWTDCQGRYSSRGNRVFPHWPCTYRFIRRPNLRRSNLARCDLLAGSQQGMSWNDPYKPSIPITVSFIRELSKPGHSSNTRQVIPSFSIAPAT